MRYLALACDYDGTLAHHGKVDDASINALKRLLASGRRLILVSGRELEDLGRTFEHFDLFELLVLENGGLLYWPATREEKSLGPKPPEKFVRALEQRRVWPMSVGRVIVATWEPHQQAVLDAIQQQGLELQVIFNKGAVMVLPAGINKASGLHAALGLLGISPHNVVGIGDAENDHALLHMCECAVAVANALPALKEEADFVTRGDHGAGVIELIDELIATDLRQRDALLTRHYLLLGKSVHGSDVHLSPFGRNILIAGRSGSGKSTVAAAIIERLAEHGYQFCIIDPEGDYESLEGAVTLGSPTRGPGAEEVLNLLERPEENVVVNLVGMKITERPGFFLSLLPRLLEMRARTGRPHWLVVDEAHHLLPASWQPGAQAVPADIDRVLMLTVHPGQVQPEVLKTVHTLLVVGEKPQATLDEFGAVLDVRPPELSGEALPEGAIVCWSREDNRAVAVRVAPAKTERRRHVRKYAVGELPPERSFYFRGAHGKLNLRAQNLNLFVQLAEGVDDETWEHHLRRGDYAHWFRTMIKDEALAADADKIQANTSAGAQETRAQVREAIERRYTLPAAGPALPIPGTDAT